MQPLIRLIDLTRAYSGAGHQVVALDGISLEVTQGSFLAITGRSGSGKSTLLNLLGGLDRPTRGQLNVDGRNLTTLNRKEMTLYRRFKVGMIFQSFNLINSITALENVEIPMVLGDMPVKERRNRAMALLESVGMTARAKHRPSELSGGEAQRVAIARALANDPPILLADEPTGNIDSQTATGIMEVLKDLQQNQGKTILMVTHDLEWTASFSDRIIRLSDGRIFSDHPTIPIH